MISYDIIWYLVTSYNIIWHHMMFYDVIWYHMTSYDIIWCHMISYDAIWYHMIAAVAPRLKPMKRMENQFFFMNFDFEKWHYQKNMKKTKFSKTCLPWSGIKFCLEKWSDHVLIFFLDPIYDLSLIHISEPTRPY